jgi:succinate dehydrogenase/fumarate reductase flavoprotein subunit
MGVRREAGSQVAADDVATDVLVLGSGAAGLSAGVTAALAGLDVIVAEKTHLLGGTTAYSEAMIWVPASHHAKAAGLEDSPGDALRYVEAVTGRHFDRERVAAYLEAAPRMLAFLEERTPVRYLLSRYSPDYYPDLPGARIGMRALNPDILDGRRLGPLFTRIRPPLASTLILGGMTITGHDLPHFFRIGRSLGSTAHVAGMTLRYAGDRLAGRRLGTRIGNGHGIVAGLVLTLAGKRAGLWTDAVVEELGTSGGAVTGAVVAHEGRRIAVTARRGVVLACGGFSGDPVLTGEHFPHVAAGKRHHTLVPSTNIGDGLRLGLSAGGMLGRVPAQPAAWAPVSLVPQPSGPPVPFPHYIDRGKPGMLAVDPRGRRFTNEAKVYQDFVPDMIAACRQDPEVAVWLIADRKAIRRYGLGAAPPAPGRLAPFVSSGYLVEARSIEELGSRTGVDPAALRETVDRLNALASTGRDSDFGKGDTPYDRAYGDPDHKPNPCFGPIGTPPYYAVRMMPGDIGTVVGLQTDADARVLDRGGAAIPGLYAAGNDMAGVFGGFYPAAGVMVGPALTFGWRAARHLIQSRA